MVPVQMFNIEWRKLWGGLWILKWAYMKCGWLPRTRRCSVSAFACHLMLLLPDCLKQYSLQMGLTPRVRMQSSKAKDNERCHDFWLFLIHVRYRYSSMEARYICFVWASNMHNAHPYDSSPAACSTAQGGQAKGHDILQQCCPNSKTLRNALQ